MILLDNTDIFDEISKNLYLVGLIFLVVGIVLLVGVIKEWKWVLEPNTRQDRRYRNSSPKAMKLTMGFSSIVFILIGIGFIVYEFVKL